MSDVDAPPQAMDEAALLAAGPRAFRRRLAWWIASLVLVAAAVAIGFSRLPATAGLALDWRHALPLAACTILWQTAMSLAMRVLLGRGISVGDANAMMFASGFLNLVAPARLGAVYRTVVGVRLAGVPIAVSLGAQAALAVIALASAGCVAIVALAIAPQLHAASLAWAIACLPLAAALPLLLAAWWRVRHDRGATPPASRAGRWLAMLAQGFAASPRQLLATFLLTAVANVFVALAVRESYLATGTPLDVAASLVLLPVAVLSSLVAIAPGGLGTREALMLLAGTALGFRPEAAVAAALFERIVASSAVLACGAPALLWLNRRRLR